MLRYVMKDGFQTGRAAALSLGVLLIMVMMSMVSKDQTCLAQEVVWPLPGRAPDILVGAEYGLEAFDGVYAPMHLGTVYGGMRSSGGAYLMKISGGRRFRHNGFQAEVEAYPILGDGMYAYASYAYGETPVFPRHRLGVEVYRALPWKLEVSLGARIFSFQNEESVLLGTGSVSYYWRSFLFSIKPFVGLNTSKTSLAGILTARYYLSDNEEFLTFRAGAGFTPDERWIQTAQGIPGVETTLLQSQSVGAAIQKIVLPKFMFLGRLDVTRQEVVFKPGAYVLDVSVGCGFRMLL